MRRTEETKLGNVCTHEKVMGNLGFAQTTRLTENSVLPQAQLVFIDQRIPNTMMYIFLIENFNKKVIH